MKTLQVLTVVVLALAAVSVADAQKRRTTPRRTTATATAKPKTTSATLPPLEVRAARVKVSNQLSNVSAFVARYGPIADNIEALDADARARKAKQASIDKNEADKQKVVAAIHGLREGLNNLEAEFRAKPDLKRYLPTIQGISQLASEAETTASAGRFVAAGVPLRSIQQKLNDTLAQMPNAEL